MKRKFTFSLVMVLAALGAASGKTQSVAVSLITGEEIPVSDVIPTICDVDASTEKTVVSYHIENVVLQADSLYDGAYKCLISDFANSEILGEPAFPQRTEYVELPLGCENASVTITNMSYSDIPYELAPSYPLFIGSKNPRFTKEHVPPVNRSVFGGESDVVVVDGFDTTFNRRYINITVRPCQYDSNSKLLRVYTDIEYAVSFSDVNQDMIQKRSSALEQQDLTFKNNISKIKISDSITKIDSAIIMPFFPPGDAAFPSLVEDDFIELSSFLHIVTCDKYLEVAEKYAAHKRKFGLNTVISSQNSWTAAQIQDSIKKYYDCNNNIYNRSQYVLILGGHTDLPAINDDIIITDTENGKSNKYEFITDFYYGCMNGPNDRTQDLYIGRIPVNTLREAQTVVNKIEEYTMSPTTDCRFYNTGAHIAYFGSSIYDWDGFVYSSESCRDAILSINNKMDVARLYYANNQTYPSWYVNGAEEIPIPDDLKYPNYHWNTDSDSISKKINDGCFYVLYRGHGLENQFCDPKFTTSDVSTLLSNGDRLPFFLNFTCLSGNFEKFNCFSEMLLKHENGGAIGLIAATVETDRSCNNALAEQCVSKLFSISKRESSNDINYIDADPPASALGSILSNAFYNNTEITPQFTFFHKTAYHIFGDPSMRIWTDMPREYTADEVWCNPHYNSQTKELAYIEVMINLYDEGCYIGVEEKETHETYLMYGSTATFPKFDPKRYSMTIYGLNRIPLEVKASETIPPLNLIGVPVAISPNPANSTCYIGYHASTSLNNALIWVTNVSTGQLIEKFGVTEHIGRIELDVSRYPNGQYLVYMTSMPTADGIYRRIAGDAQLIVQH